MRHKIMVLGGRHSEKREKNLLGSYDIEQDKGTQYAIIIQFDFGQM